MKFVIYIICSIFAAVAIALFFDIFNLSHEKIKKEDKLFDSGSGAKQSLKRVVSYYQGKRDFFMVEEVNKAKKILDNTNRANEYRKTLILCLVLAAVGTAIGIFLKNFLLIPVLAIGLFMIPLWRLKMYQAKYKKYITMQLESSVSLITTSYLRNNNIIEAIEENVDNLSNLIKPHFEEFLAEYRIDPNIRNCIYNLQSKINNSIFREWCEGLVKAYENSEMRENLLATVEKFSSVRIVQDDLDAETATSLQEYIIMLGVLVLVFPMVKLINDDWFASYATGLGKVAVVYAVVVALFAVKKLIDLTEPVQYER